MLKRRLILFDAGLQSKHGHHLNVDLGITREAEKRGLEWIVYGNLSCTDPEIHELLRPKPLFKTDIYGSITSSQNQASDWAVSNVAFFESLISLDSSKFRSDDILFFHTIHSPNLLGLARWLDRITPAVQPLVIIYVLYPDYIDMWTGRPSARAAIFKEGLLLLSKIPFLQLRILAETPSIKADLEKLAEQNLRVDLGPFPGNYQNIIESCLWDSHLPDGDTDLIWIGYFGRTRIRKGVLLLPQIITISTSLRSNIRFAVQLDADGDYGTLLSNTIVELSGNPNTLYINGAMSTEEYFAQLRRCRIVLLPYSKGYNRQGSGILSESVASGKILVVPQYNNFQEQLIPYDAASVYFSEWNATSIADALVEAVDQIDELRAKAVKAAPRYLRDRGPAAFFDGLFKSTA